MTTKNPFKLKVPKHHWEGDKLSTPIKGPLSSKEGMKLWGHIKKEERKSKRRVRA